MSNYDIYGIGAALLDTEIDVNDNDLIEFEIEKGLMTLVDEERQHTLVNLLKNHLIQSKRSSGGSAANSIIGAAYFGSSTFYSCKVADDENGQFYLNDLKNAGVDYHKSNATAAGVTGKCLVMITPDAERTMNTFLGVSETLSVEDIDETALKNSSFAYIEGYLVSSETGRAAAIAVRKIAEENNVKVSLSLSDPAIAEHFRSGLKQMIGTGVDLLFCNQDEALSYTESSSLDEACSKLAEISKSFVITRGSSGALVYDGDTCESVDGVVAKAVDTNGAGDMFAGAFLHAINAGHSYFSAARFANKAAAKVVSQYGPRLSREDYEALLPIS